MKLCWEDKISLLQAVFCAAFIALDVLLHQAWATVPATSAVISWQLALSGRETRIRWPPALGLVLALGTNVIWLIFFHRIVLSPLLCCLIGLETHQFFDRWKPKAGPQGVQPR